MSDAKNSKWTVVNVEKMYLLKYVRSLSVLNFFFRVRTLHEMVGVAFFNVKKLKSDHMMSRHPLSIPL